MEEKGLSGTQSTPEVWFTELKSGLAAAGARSSAAARKFIDLWRGRAGDFSPVFEKELEAINARRGAGMPPEAGESRSAPEQGPGGALPDFDNPKGVLKEVLEEQRQWDEAWRRVVEEKPETFKHPGLAGLSLSGGGIRSATFSLGALQILDSVGIFRKLDYLSTVSGGGYIGCCLSSLYSTGQTGFPFQHQIGEVENQRFKHLREYSNYLAPHGILDRLRMPALFLRGLCLNFILVLPFILGTAGIYTLVLQGYPAIELMFRDFYFTTWLVLILAAAFIAYPVAKRVSGFWSSVCDSWWERNGLTRGLGFYLGLVLLTTFVEAQPYVVQFYHELGSWSSDTWTRVFHAGRDAVGWLVVLGTTVFGFFVAKDVAMVGAEKKSIRLLVLGILGPLLVWLLFIILAKWAFYPGDGLMETAMNGLGAQVQPVIAGLAEQWLSVSLDRGVAGWYIVAGLVVFAFGWFVNVNDYSLHGFYRDRLSKAYLMRSGPDSVPPAHNDIQPLASGSASASMPYHIVNAALNVTKPEKEKAGEKMRRPGRTADSFFFTRDSSGSDATGFCKTSTLETYDPWLNLGTAMAISGAAFAPNMGNATLRPLVFVLTMLNVRLCYWLINPRLVNLLGPLAWLKIPGRWLLFKELLSTLDTTDNYINLSDGGHMDNLGVYELLRRRTRLIIAIDAEADRAYQFEGLATVCRLVQIDMGIAIEFDKKDLDAIGGGLRHHAIGRIRYTDTVEGRIIYLKASTSSTGDSVYVDRYQTLHPDFPHESTMDQFYDEEQFECYRALGYEVAKSVFEAADALAMPQTALRDI